MKKIVIVVVIIIAIICGALYKSLDRKQTEKEQPGAENENVVYEKQKVDNDNNENNEKEVQINIEEFNVEEGFMSSIDTNGMMEDIIKNNNLLETQNSINDRLDAKNVAENFVQAICSFNIDEPDKTVDKAVKYVVDEKKEEIRSLYLYLGKNKDIKKTEITSVESREVKNREDNDWIIFNVKVSWNVIDQYDKEISENHESYEVRLNKINDEYRVVQYRIR